MSDLPTNGSGHGGAASRGEHVLRPVAPATPEALAPATVVRRFGRSRLTCRLTTLHPERGLSRAVVQHLAEEMPDIDFCMSHRPDADVIWLLGYELGASAVIRALRAEHPHALILVTMRGSVERWGSEVRAAGADLACGWPIPYVRLSQLLHRRNVPHAVG